MNLKIILAGFIGLIVGASGYYMLGRSPSVSQHEIQPSTPPNVALMFSQDMTANVSYGAKSLMTPSTRHHFTKADWLALRHWVGKSDGYGIATYEVLTFSHHRSLTLWLTTPIGGPNSHWEIQQIKEGTTVTSTSSSPFVQVSHP